MWQVNLVIVLWKKKKRLDEIVIFLAMLLIPLFNVVMVIILFCFLGYGHNKKLVVFIKAFS